MKIRKLFKYICLLVPAIVFICGACSGNGSDSEEREEPVPRFILEGTQVGSDTDFIYYSIEGKDEYAVALTKTGKGKSSITIDDKYNNKPITGIWRYGFANSQATSVTIPDTITKIDFEAFMNCKITSVTIPASVNQIGEAAFYACKAITKVTIQNTTTSTASSSACMCDVGSAGSSGTPSELKKIPSFCFYNCNNLKELVLPQSIEEVGYEAFNGCIQLYSTIAFSSITTIRSRAFQGCAALKKVYISSSFFEKEKDEHGDPVGEPIGIIEDKAFDGCNTNLKFYLVGDTTVVERWLYLHRDNRWRWKNETTNPDASSSNPQDPDSAIYVNCYEYEITAAGASYTNDWIYTTANNGEVTITSYIGPTEIEVEVNGSPVMQSIKLINFPNELPSGSGNPVVRINVDALTSVQANLERVYLPTTLKRIEPRMFNDNYDKLVVVDDNTGSCSDDDSAGASIDKRIVLNGLTSLKVIGNSAFVNMDNLTQITKLYLPYSLIAVGSNAFGSPSKNNGHMRAVTDFRWEYNESSQLEVIGGGAFYGLGRSDSNKLVTSGAAYQERYTNQTENYKLTSLVFPRTFKHFGITSNDNTNYELGGEEGDDANFGANAFAGCPLISDVVFKGSTVTINEGVVSINTSGSDTCDLIIPNQTFVLNESLRTVVFEERYGKSILFHTAGRKYLPAIGWSSGKRSNDFGGNPGIQTIVLPNKNTTIRMQQYAMQGNSRAAVYLSGNGNNSNFKGCSEGSCKKIATNGITTGNVNNLDSDGKWKLIGDEGFDETANTYPGYCFATNVNNQDTDTYNRFNLNQSMPVYTNVLYNQPVTVKTGKTETPATTTVIAYVGKDNSNEFIISRKCAYVTNGNNATMTKFLYDRYETSFTGTAVVAPSVTKTGGITCQVTQIGASAFSAAYCDQGNNNYKDDTYHKDLVAVAIPNTITTINEYAFMRAYGVRNLYAYDTANYNANAVPTPRIADNYYVMPEALTSIGKHAFAFCNIEQFLRIPTVCTFYETTDNNVTNYDTSVFSNNFSLRKITFENGSHEEVTSSGNYETTTYTTANGANTYTSALYSTNSVAKNKSSLLLVLNRNSADYLCESSISDSKDVTKKSKEENAQTVYYSELNGQYRGTYVYGAFKMCYWIDSLVVGTPSFKNNDNSYDNQPLISGIYDVAGGKDKPLYLNTANDFNANKDNCNLESVTFNGSLDTPPYSFEGCGKLKYVTLPRIEGGEIPTGLFAFASSSGLKFRVPSDATGVNFKTCDDGVLDLAWTAYSKINADAFKGTQINTLIAPKPWVDDDPNTDNNPNTFTIEQDAFRGCEHLSLIDFSNVTGRVVIKAAFRGSTADGDITKIPNGLFNFGNTAKIEFGAEAFSGATFTGVNGTGVNPTFEFPEKTAIIGTSCFEDCETLERVTATGVLSELEPVAVDTGKNKNNEDIVTLAEGGKISSSAGFKQIGDYAFFHCTNLKDFDFSKFEGVERIGHGAFSMVKLSGGVFYAGEKNEHKPIDNNASITLNSEISLPASVTNIGVAAFYGTQITKVTINSSTIRFERGNSAYTADARCNMASSNKGNHAFRWCSKLTEVFFSNPDCEWRQVILLKSEQGQENYFSNCGKLERIFLPTGFDIQPSRYTSDNVRPDSMVYKSYGSLDFYLYHTVNDIKPSAKNPFPIISQFWHRMDVGIVASRVYYAANESDVVVWNETSQKYELIADANEEYWTMKNGVPLYLGKVTAVNPTTGAVTFSESVTLNSLTYAKNDGAPTSLSYDPLNDTVRASTSITVEASDVITVNLNGNALKYGLSGNDTSFTATMAGTYTLVVNGSDRFFITDTTSVVIQENSVTITEREIDLTQENSVTLAAVPTPVGATDEKIWSSSDQSVATVSNGVVTPVSAGTTRITVYMGASSAYVDVTVNDYCVMTINSTPTRVTSYNASNTTHAQQNITLAVDDEVSVTLNGDSLYYGAEGSETTFVATTAGDYVLTIDSNNRFYVTCAATAVSINEGDSHTLHIGTDLSYQLTTTLTPTNATDTLVWTTTDESVATVSDSGLVTPVSAGTATIAVMAGNAYDLFEVTVLDPYCVLTYGQNGGTTEVELEYDVSSNTIRAQQELELLENDVVSITLNDVDLKYGQSGNNTSFTASADGTYNIIVNASNRFFYELDAEEVDIQENSSSVSERIIYVGESDVELTAVLSPNGATSSVVWTSDDPNEDIVTILGNNTTCTVSPVARGTATITATSGSGSDTVEFTVKDITVSVANGGDTPMNYSGISEGHKQFSATISPSTGDALTFKNSGNSIAFANIDPDTDTNLIVDNNTIKVKTGITNGTIVLTEVNAGSYSLSFVVPSTNVEIFEGLVSLSKDTKKVFMGEGPFTVTADILPAAHTDTLAWNSEHTNVATIDANGEITLVGPGSTRITASTGNASDYFDLIVKAFTVSVNGTPTTLDFDGTNTYTGNIATTINNTLVFNDGTNNIATNNISFASNTNLYKDDGAIKVIHGNDAAITVTDNGNGTYTVDFAHPDYDLYKNGAKVDNPTTTTPGSGNVVKYVIALSTTTPDVVSVKCGKDTIGSHTALYNATYNIAVTDGDTLDVTIPATGVSIQKSGVDVTTTQTLYVGDPDDQLTAAISPNGCTDEVVWTSGDDSILTVDEDTGLVTAVARGSTTVTVTVGGFTDTVTYNIKERGYTARINNTGAYIPLDNVDTGKYYSDEVTMAANDSVTIYYDDDPQNSYTRIDQFDNNLGAGGIINPGKCVISVTPALGNANIFVTGYARITYNGVSYIAKTEDSNSYYITVDVVAGGTVTAGSIGTTSKTLVLNSATGNNLTSNAGVLTVVANSSNANIYMHDDTSEVWVTGPMGDIIRVIYGTSGESDSTWNYANGVHGEYLSPSDPSVQDQAEYVVELAAGQAFKFVDANGNYYGAGCAESPYSGTGTNDIPAQGAGIYHIYLKKYVSSYGIAVDRRPILVSRTISIDSSFSGSSLSDRTIVVHSWTDTNSIAYDSYIEDGVVEVVQNYDHYYVLVLDESETELANDWSNVDKKIKVNDSSTSSINVFYNSTADKVLSTVDSVACPTGYKIDVTNNFGWSGVNIHYWGTNVTDTTWPGMALGAGEEANHYAGVIPFGAEYFIINGDGSQTGNLTLTDYYSDDLVAVGFWFDGSVGNVRFYEL